LVLLNGDQSTVAEPRFHGHSPQHGDSAVIILRHASDDPPKRCEQQPENDLALAQSPTPTLGVVMEDGAGGAAFEAAPRSVIEFVH